MNPTASLVLANERIHDLLIEASRERTTRQAPAIYGRRRQFGGWLARLQNALAQRSVATARTGSF